MNLGDRDRARTLYRLLAPYAHLDAVASGEVFSGSVARYLRMLATATGAPHDAARHLEDALETNERMGARPWVAHTQCAYAGMRLARGDREQADAALERARDVPRARHGDRRRARGGAHGPAGTTAPS